LIGWITPEQFIENFRDNRIFLPAIRTMNLATTAGAGSAPVNAQHFLRQLVFAKGAFHPKTPVAKSS
jgi:hypothetical protein